MLNIKLRRTQADSNTCWKRSTFKMFKSQSGRNRPFQVFITLIVLFCKGLRLLETLLSAHTICASLSHLVSMLCALCVSRCASAEHTDSV